MAAVAFKVGVVLLCALLGAWALSVRWFREAPEGAFLKGLIGLQLLPGLALFLGVYVFGHQEVTSDVPAYYLPAARAVLAGQLPMRDFTLSYAPLFPYVGAGLVSIWDSGKVFALLAICAAVASSVWWYQAALTGLSRSSARTCALLYATAGHVTVQSLLGTNQLWISALLAASVVLLMRGRSAGSGWVQALALCATKILVLLFWPVLWICAPHRWKWLMAATAASVVVYGGFALQGADLLYPVRFEGQLISSGNLPFLLEPVFTRLGATGHGIFDLLAAAALGGSLAWLAWRVRPLTSEQRRRVLLPALALLGLVFMLVSKKSFTGYALFCLFPALAGLVSSRPEGTPWRGLLAFTTLFNLLLAVEPSLWFQLGGNQLNLSGWLASARHRQAQWFVLLDLCLTSCYVYLSWLSVRSLERAVDGAINSRKATQSSTACSLV